jgi:drug/metabolite transporter (DMT)-like permease
MSTSEESQTSFTSLPEQQDSHASTAAIWAALIALYISWGSTYLAIRIAIESIPPFLMAGTRFVVAGAIMFGWAYARGEARGALSQVKSAAITGVLLLLCGNGLVVWAEKSIPSGIVALIVGLCPFWMVIISWIWERNARPSLTTALGLLVGFAGLLFLVLPDLIGKHSASGAKSLITPGGLLSVTVATLSWAFGSIYSRRRQLPSSPIFTIAIEMLSGGTALIVAGLLMREFRSEALSSVTLRSVFALGYLIVFGSIIGFSSYIYLLRATTVARASTYAYVNPVVAIFLGWLIAGEPLNWRVIVSAALITGAVALISRKQPAATPEAEPA